MFTNQAACTMYEKTVDESTRTEKYIRHVIKNIYWQELTGQTGDKSRSPEDAILCIIPAASLAGYIPKRDDIIVLGACASDEPPENGFTVSQVKNFLYGSADVRHIEVNAV